MIPRTVGDVVSGLRDRARRETPRARYGETAAVRAIARAERTWLRRAVRILKRELDL